MNYEPNTQQWFRGDAVIHDADAKRPDMLMRVIGYTKDGLIRTIYVDTAKHGRTVYQNELKYLHDPRRFEIKQGK